MYVEDQSAAVLRRFAEVGVVITAAQLRAARALLGIDQRRLAALSSLSLPTIQRMEASGGVVRGNVDSLTKLITALELAGIELIGPGAMSTAGGRGVRLRAQAPDTFIQRGGTEAADTTRGQA